MRRRTPSWHPCSTSSPPPSGRAMSPTSRRPSVDIPSWPTTSARSGRRPGSPRRWHASPRSRPTGEETLAPPGAAGFAALTPGSLRFGEYELFEELGRGGMGVVSRAVEVARGRVVAIKRLLRGPDSSAQDIDRFRVEAQAASRLAHPHVVPIFQVGECDDQPFFTMQYVEGTTLARKLADGPMPARRGGPAADPRLPRDPVRPRPRRPAPRPEAVQHPDRPPGEPVRQRLRPGQADRRGPLAHALRRPGGHAQLHGARAGRQPDGRRPVGHRAGERRLRPGRDPLPHAHRPSAVPGRHGGRDDPAGARARPDLAPGAQPPGQPRPRDDRAQVPPEVPSTAVPDGRRPWPTTSRRSSAAIRSRPARRASATWPRGCWARPITPRSPRTGALLWIYHSIALIVFFGATNGSTSRASPSRWPYVLIFTPGLCGWAAIFWALRRRGGPIRFVEKQLAHVWGAGIVSINLIFLVEWLLGMPVLSLSPMIAVTNGMLFMIKGGILSGDYYLQAALTFAAIFPMAAFPRFAPMIFGVVGLGLLLRRGPEVSAAAASARRDRPPDPSSAFPARHPRPGESFHDIRPEETAADHRPFRHGRHRGDDRRRGRQPRHDGQRRRLAVAGSAPDHGRRRQARRDARVPERATAASP